MRKFLCLLLVLWLPLFTGSAWAMRTQMQLDQLQGMAETHMLASHPCHDMPGMQVSGHDDHATPSTMAMQDTEKPGATDAGKQDRNGHCQGHDCFACGICLHATNFTLTVMPPMPAPMLSHAKPVTHETVFASLRYPPALKPPIDA